MQKITKFIHTKITAAQACYKEQANQSPRPARRYQIGQMAWLDARNIRMLRPQKKLGWKFLGLFRISEIISLYTYKLDLPASMKIHYTAPCRRRPRPWTSC
jgi:hypothetical protein